MVNFSFPPSKKAKHPLIFGNTSPKSKQHERCEQSRSENLENLSQKHTKHTKNTNKQVPNVQFVSDVLQFHHPIFGVDRVEVGVGKPTTVWVVLLGHKSCTDMLNIQKYPILFTGNIPSGTRFRYIYHQKFLSTMANKDPHSLRAAFPSLLCYTPWNYHSKNPWKSAFSTPKETCASEPNHWFSRVPTCC